MINEQQFNMRDIPAPFGTAPIPEGHVRFNHYTRSTENIPGIRAHGLQVEEARKSFARGGTESPQTFMTAGTPSSNFLHSHNVVEGHIHPDQLDIGRGRTPESLYERGSTITTNVDVPKENIIGIHEPWHSTFRYIQNEPSMEQNIMRGMYDRTGDADTDKAVGATKVALAQKVMLGGRLGGDEHGRGARK